MSPDLKYPATEAREARRRGDIDFLLRLLNDIDIVGRRAAAYNLGKIGDAGAVPALVRCLNARDELLRSSAVAALGEIGETSAIPAIFESASQDESHRVRTAAVQALVELGDHRAASLLVGMLRDERAPYPRTFRKWALRSLVELGGIEALPDLRAVARSVGPLERLRFRKTIKALEAVQRKESSPRK